MDLLAAWVWGSFNPGKTISDIVKREEAAKIKAACDKNGDG
jgi:hypothetical protein